MKRIPLLLLTLLFFNLVQGQTKSEVRASELPKPISDYISKNLSGFSIDKAFKVVDKGVQTYSVLVKKGEIKQNLTFDKEGTFLKKTDGLNKTVPSKAGEQIKNVPAPKKNPASDN